MLVAVYRRVVELSCAPQEAEGLMAVPVEIASVRQAVVGLFLENWELVSL